MRLDEINWDCMRLDEIRWDWICPFRRTNFRWWQKGDQSSGFAIDDVYVGTPCPEMCNGHGLCVSGTCRCDPGFEGTYFYFAHSFVYSVVFIDHLHCDILLRYYHPLRRLLCGCYGACVGRCTNSLHACYVLLIYCHFLLHLHFSWSHFYLAWHNPGMLLGHNM